MSRAPTIIAVAGAPISRRERKKGRTRADIYNAAMNLFLRRGFDSVTIEDICDSADVARATFFLHFPAKEALLIEYGKRANDELAAAIAEYHGSATRRLGWRSSCWRSGRCGIRTSCGW